MKLMIALENVTMDGVKRASTVLGNALAAHVDVLYFSLADAPRYFTLQAPLLIAEPPADPQLLNFFGDHPYQRYEPQIANLIDTIDAYHIDAVLLPAGLLTSFAPLIKKALPWVRLIGWMHNNFTTYTEDYYGQMRGEFKAGLQAVDTLVVLTESDLREYRQFNPNTVKRYNPITLTPHHLADLTRHQIAFTGRIAIQHKGIDLLLSAAKQLRPGWQITMAGSGTPKDMALFQRLRTLWGLEAVIDFRGPLHDDELRAHYANAAIFVSTSRWEGMPLVIGEAMAAGLPIVAMRNTGSAEFLQDNEYGLLTKAADVADFSTQLNRMIDSLALRQHYAHQSLRRANDFKLDVIVQQWLDLLQP
ncbi:glycosyltransferase [Lacticaseibacillus baoqingensis]|uniref:Glycosyltransferase n=1 Tax=Lacticaseibacillus baoqingensis TaxID=2486013 RepID=A0ABW4E4R0_9LACO|nr:glycosyltransferase [Lacticaseibacillus baoqingensis]